MAPQTSRSSTRPAPGALPAAVVAEEVASEATVAAAVIEVAASDAVAGVASAVVVVSFIAHNNVHIGSCSGHYI